LLGTCGWIGEVARARGGGMSVFVERHHLPDRRVAIPLSHGVQGHLPPVVSQQWLGVQQLQDLHQHLDRYPCRDRCGLPCMCGQAQHAEGLEALPPGIDDMGSNGESLGDPAGAKPHLQQLKDPPPSLCFRGVFVVGAKT
jgi:hypothetical protein